MCVSTHKKRTDRRAHAYGYFHTLGHRHVYEHLYEVGCFQAISMMLPVGGAVTLAFFNMTILRRNLAISLAFPIDMYQDIRQPWRHVHVICIRSCASIVHIAQTTPVQLDISIVDCNNDSHKHEHVCLCMCMCMQVVI